MFEYMTAQETAKKWNVLLAVRFMSMDLQDVRKMFN